MAETESPNRQPFNHSGFNAYLAEGRLMAARCANCGQVSLPPRAMCPACYSTHMEWVELSGRGVLAGFTTIHVGLPAMIAEGYDREKPYCSGVVRLAEGVAISGQILGADGAPPEEIQVGMPVRADFIERGSGENRKTFLVFRKDQAY